MCAIRCLLLMSAFFVALAPPAAFAQSGQVTVENPFARPSAGPAGAGAAYMTILNAGAADRLIAVSTPAARAAELHAHIRDGDVMRMRRIEAVDVPEKGAAQLAPGGLHVMLIGPVRPLKPGDAFALTLTFEKAGAVTVQVPVLDMRAGAAPAQGGHQPGMPKSHNAPKN